MSLDVETTASGQNDAKIGVVVRLKFSSSHTHIPRLLSGQSSFLLDFYQLTLQNFIHRSFHHSFLSKLKVRHIICSQFSFKIYPIFRINNSKFPIIIIIPFHSKIFSLTYIPFLYKKTKEKKGTWKTLFPEKKIHFTVKEEEIREISFDILPILSHWMIRKSFCMMHYLIMKTLIISCLYFKIILISNI